jgi:thiamine kinase-like enzyme
LYFEGKTAEWGAQANAQEQITNITIGGEDTWVILGPAFFNAQFSETFAPLVREYYDRPGTDDFYWEHILKENLSELPIKMNKQSNENVHEFESLEELRLYDESYQNNSSNQVMHEIAEAFGVAENTVTDILPIKDGAMNKSFAFNIGEQRYVFRIPGSTSNKLVDRTREFAAYTALEPLDLTDELIRFNVKTGTKIARYYTDARTVNPHNLDDVKLSIKLIKTIHQSGLVDDYEYSLDKTIAQYHSLAKEAKAIRFTDFDEVDNKMQQLLKLKNKLDAPLVLCHGDFNQSNVLILPGHSGRIIDWEFGGMADPFMDLAMFAIYADFGRSEIERLLSCYLEHKPTENDLCRLYLHVALCGFLWSIWAEYEQAEGKEFGEYPLRMYRYAKDYYNIIISEGYLRLNSN